MKTFIFALVAGIIPALATTNGALAKLRYKQPVETAYLVILFIWKIKEALNRYAYPMDN